MNTETPVLEVDNLQVRFYTEEGEVRAVNGVSFVMPRGRIMALVGESGCGKSVTGYSVMRLIQKPGRITGGHIWFQPRDRERFDILALPENSRNLFDVRGGLASMIFQEPMTALSPVHTIGNQLCEGLFLHKRMTKKQAEAIAVDMLTRVGIPGAERRMRQYPFELSGGMRQRVVIAMALVCQPELVIADEPTTALDVTIQAQILRLIKDLQKDSGVSVLLITHDLGVVGQMADTVAVMYLGRIVELAPVRDLVRHPRHPYTMGLLQSLPSLCTTRRLPSIPGTVPSLNDIPPGCPFHPRCAFAKTGLCDVGEPPPATPLEDGRVAACLRARDPEVLSASARLSDMIHSAGAKKDSA